MGTTVRVCNGSVFVKVLCPRCETGNPKSKSKRTKDASPTGKKTCVKTCDCLGDVERALSESKDTASAVGFIFVVYLFFLMYFTTGLM